MRRHFACVLLIVVGALTAAADDTPPAEPALVLTLSNVDSALRDVDDLLRAGNAPQYADFVRGLIEGLNDLRGIDRTRPLAGMLFLHRDDPEHKPSPLICLPVSDIPALRTTVAATGNTLEPTDDVRVYQLRLGKDDFRLLLVEGYAFLTAVEAPPPAYSPERLLTVIEESAAGADLSLRFRRGGIPEVQIGKLLAEFDADAARELTPRPDEGDEDYRLRADLQRSVFDLLRLVVLEGEELAVLLDVNVDRPLTAQATFRVREGGELGPWLRKTLTRPKRLNPPAEPLPALRFQAAGNLSERGRDISRRGLALLRRGVLQELGPQVPVDVLEQVERAIEAIDSTLAAGTLETRLEFLPTPAGRFVLLGGFAVEQAEAIDGVIRSLIPLAAASGDVARAEVESFRINELTFHRVQGNESRDRDRKLYGADLALSLAAGGEAVWLAVGGAETAIVLADLMAPPDESDGPHAPVTLSLRLGPWIEFAAREGGAREQTVARLAGELLSAGDSIEVELSPDANGLQLSVSVDESYVRLASKLAILRAQQQRKAE
ncbi:MAG: hypothetical protein KDA75_07235 [Planctomycetaceae bacterium]|nr:hypothetical protein [Planctomycetaceae bacterium]